MIFIETTQFTADVASLLEQEEYRTLQQYLTEYPDAGALIEETGGLRKIRWATRGKGKSGGVRVIYYHVFARAQIRMLLIYRKGIQDTLTKRQKSVLRSINQGWR